MISAMDLWYYSNANYLMIIWRPHGDVCHLVVCMSTTYLKPWTLIWPCSDTWFGVIMLSHHLRLGLALKRQQVHPCKYEALIHRWFNAGPSSSTQTNKCVIFAWIGPNLISISFTWICLYNYAVFKSVMTVGHANTFVRFIGWSPNNVGVLSLLFDDDPANTTNWNNVVLKLGQRRRRLANI